MCSYCVQASTRRRTATRPVQHSTSSQDQAIPWWMASGSTGRTRTCSACRAGPATSTSTPASSRPSCSATPTCQSCGRWTSIVRRRTQRAGNSTTGEEEEAMSLSGSETSVTRKELLRRTTALLPVLKERAARTEQLRQMPPETVQDLVAAGLIRLGNPQRYGGLGVEYDAAFDVSWELGRACGSTAWCYALWTVHNWWIGHFPEAAQEEFFAGGPDVLASSALNPTRGTAEPVAGGYRVSGPWSFYSGCD